jgi:hypothetical protein
MGMKGSSPLKQGMALDCFPKPGIGQLQHTSAAHLVRSWTQIPTELRMNSLPSSDVECGMSYQHAVRTSVEAGARISVPHRCLLPRKVTENDMNEQSRVGI